MSPENNQNFQSQSLGPDPGSTSPSSERPDQNTQATPINNVPPVSENTVSQNRSPAVAPTTASNGQIYVNGQTYAAPPSSPMLKEKSNSLKWIMLAVVVFLVFLGLTIGGTKLINKHADLPSTTHSSQNKPQTSTSQQTTSTTSTTGPKQGWVSYKSSDGTWSAYFPGQPTAQAPTSISSQGETVTEQTTSVGTNPEYAVITTTYPPGTSASVSYSQMDSLIGSTVSQKPSGNLISSNNTSFNGDDAVTFEYTEVDSGTTYYVNGEVIFSANTLYNFSSKYANTVAPDSQYFLSNLSVN